MRVDRIDNNTFGILVGKPIRRVYAPKCWNDISEGKYKDYEFLIYNNFQNNTKGSTLIIVKKAGTWVKSKLKYIFNGQKKTLWSYAEDKKKGV